MEIKTLKTENKELHHRLNQRNDYKMTDIIAYLRDQDLTQASFETIRNKLLREAVHAQENGRAIETVFGYEPEKYVDEEIRRVPPATPEERRYGAFRLWGMAVIILTAISIGFDLVNDAISGMVDQFPTGLWTISFTDLAFLIMLLGISITLGAHFSRHRLLHDPDFFSNSGNRLGSFMKSYGVTLVILMIGVALIFLFGGQILLELPYPVAGAVLAGSNLVWNVLMRVLKNQADASR